MRRTATAAFAAAVLVTTAGACSSSSTTAAGGRIPVVAAENFWGDVVRQIGGEHVQVTSLIDDPSADPHLFEVDARSAKAVASARLVVKNGLGYDDFVDELLSSTNANDRKVVTAADVKPAVPDGSNPHLWYDLARVRLVAGAIERELAKADPSHRREYAANRVQFNKSLEPIVSTLDVIKQRFAGDAAAYTERVPEYMLDAAGLKVDTPRGFTRAIEDGNEPSAGDTQRMRELLQDHKVRVLLYNSQATSPITNDVRQEANSVGTPVVAVTETMPKAAHSYASWMLEQANALRNALADREKSQ